MTPFKYILLLLCCATPFWGTAQQLPQFSQYTFNTIAINPAYAGARDVFAINLLNRNQWVGIKGAPETQTIAINSSIPNSKFGIGLSAINDQLGYEKSTFIYSDLSFTIDMSRFQTRRLSFGLKAGLAKYDLDKDIYNDPDNQNDNLLTNFNSKWRPNFGFGLYFRTDRLFLGLGIPKLFDIAKSIEQEFKTYQEINLYINGGYLLELNSDFKIKPTFMVKYLKGSPLAIDLNAYFILMQDKLWLGAAYRIGDAIGAQARYQIIQGLYLGYAYDFTTSNLNPYSYGSHEVILSFEFKFRNRKCACPDLFN